MHALIIQYFLRYEIISTRNFFLKIFNSKISQITIHAHVYTSTCMYTVALHFYFRHTSIHRDQCLQILLSIMYVYTIIPLLSSALAENTLLVWHVMMSGVDPAEFEALGSAPPSRRTSTMSGYWVSWTARWSGLGGREIDRLTKFVWIQSICNICLHIHTLLIRNS